jgi:hypothetical protein
MSKETNTSVVRYVMGTKHNPNGEEGTEDEVVWVETTFQPQESDAQDACDWCGQLFDDEDDGDMRRVEGMTKNADGDMVFTGDHFHGECDYERDAATSAALEEMKKKKGQ